MYVLIEEKALLFNSMVFTVYDGSNMTISTKLLLKQEPIKMLSFLMFPDR